MFTTEDIWRSGNLLVMRKGARLPDRCIKTNRSANGKRFKATLYWHHPIIYLLILFNLLIYLIVAIAVQKKAVVYLGVTEQTLQARSKAILWAWLVGIAGVILCIYALSSPVELGGLILLGVFMILGGLIGGLVKAPLVGTDRIEGEYIWIRGISKEYLALLPEWNPARKSPD
jgi:hypothetical protein